MSCLCEGNQLGFCQNYIVNPAVHNGMYGFYASQEGGNNKNEPGRKAHQANVQLYHAMANDQLVNLSLQVYKNFGTAKNELEKKGKTFHLSFWSFVEGEWKEWVIFR